MFKFLKILFLSLPVENNVIKCCDVLHVKQRYVVFNNEVCVQIVNQRIKWFRGHEQQ